MIDLLQPSEHLHFAAGLLLSGIYRRAWWLGFAANLAKECYDWRIVAPYLFDPADVACGFLGAALGAALALLPRMAGEFNPNRNWKKQSP